MSWPTVEIKKVARVVGGATPKSGVSEYWDGEIAWATPKDLAGLDGKEITDTPRKITDRGLRSCAAEQLPAGSVLFSSRAPIGHIAINRAPMATNQGFKSFVPGPDLDASFLYWWLDANRGRLQAMGNGATFKEVSKAVVERIVMPLPALPEQRRIAAILDQADALRSLRRQSLSRLSDLRQAIFFEMFGDPNRLEGARRTIEIGKFCSVSSGSTPRRDNHDYYGGNIPWVKTTEVKGSTIHCTEECITEEGKRSARLKVYPKGTILIAMYGQGKTRGNAAILGIDATINQACAAIQCDESCRPRFLFLQLKMAYERLRALGQGGNQPNLNAQLVKAFQVLLPELAEQDNFLQKIDAVDTSEISAVSQGENFEQLFASLQHRAFRGEL